MVPETPPTAEGDLAQTPFAHLLVYALDRRLTGELFLFEAPEVTHAICFDRGQPVKIRMGDEYARLGTLLVEEGLVSADIVENAVGTGGLLGDMLVLAGYVESEPLNRVIEQQFELRMRHFFELPETVTYSYFDQSESLKDWGGDPMRLDSLALLWRGIREHGEKSTLFDVTLEKVKDVALTLHARTTLASFELEDDAKVVAEVLSLDPATLEELVVMEGVSPDIVRKVVYALTISRQFDLGRGTLPLGVEEERTRQVAKVQLRSQVHRVGAAVDVPGDGERSTRSLSVRGRAVIPRDDSTEPPPNVDFSEGEVEVGEAEVDPAELEENESADDASGEVAAAVAADAEPAPAAKGDEIGEESTRRLVSDTIRALPPEALLKLAREKLDEKEPTMAVEVSEVGLKKLSEAGDTRCTAYSELVATRAWASSLEPHPQLKALTVDLDELIREKDALSLPRYVRGLLRKRLGDSAGATSDFRRVLELEPGHELALRELPSVDTGVVSKRGETGFLKRLFRR
jgi:hypothetical protein